ncbi:conserved hypothetical protein [Trichinella spiralis]|uniref:hypothetical protein n=1 Tax=Trichinella spiralis TaxID=6334 RepID=UPI0001EFD650|nr:conserved hypothetical protein [Trichinella spiralis]
MELPIFQCCLIETEEAVSSLTKNQKNKQIFKNKKMKKIERKLRKLIASLQKHEPDVVITEQPSQNLFVANGGLDCGVSPEELRHFCAEHAAGTFDIYVRIHKPYSFVHFDSIQDAITLTGTIDI